MGRPVRPHPCLLPVHPCLYFLPLASVDTLLLTAGQRKGQCLCVSVPGGQGVTSKADLLCASSLHAAPPLPCFVELVRKASVHLPYPSTPSFGSCCQLCFGDDPNMKRAPPPGWHEISVFSERSQCTDHLHQILPTPTPGGSGNTDAWLLPAPGQPESLDLGNLNCQVWAWESAF